MKLSHLFFGALLTFGFISCGGKKEEMKEDEKKSTVLADFQYDTLKGIYAGDFGGSEIRIIITYISHKHVVGYDIHKGLQRNLSGSVSENDSTLTLSLNEPGDHPYDGTFHLNFRKDNLKCNGSWVAFQKKYGSKKFTLEKLNLISYGGFDYEHPSIDQVNKNNFVSLFYRASDAIGDIYFEEDGMVRYEYYPSKDSLERVEQLKVIKGMWTYKDAKVQVRWTNSNDVFKDKLSVFTISLDSNQYFQLETENRTFYVDMY